MKFIQNVGRAYRMFSVQAMAISTATLATWAALPEKYQAIVPSQYVHWGVAVVLVGGIVGRLVDQGEATKP